MSLNQCPGDPLSHGAVVVDTLAQVFVGRVIGEPSEFVLDCLGKVRVLDDRILCHLAREFRVEVGDVQHGFLERPHRVSVPMGVGEDMSTYDTGFERRLDLLCHQSSPIDIPGKERMSLDLISSMITQPPLRVPLQQSGHHAPRFGGDVRGEVERIREDPLVHDVDILVIERR